MLLERSPLARERERAVSKPPHMQKKTEEGMRFLTFPRPHAHTSSFVHPSPLANRKCKTLGALIRPSLSAALLWSQLEGPLLPIVINRLGGKGGACSQKCETNREDEGRMK
mmetsp:Transcript_55294/g.108199  ORF Transcript_55294/g.108199 Transcript_55294/m.108199 type:complete len:111 (-) Transcript_55294:714-1046(-)